MVLPSLDTTLWEVNSFQNERNILFRRFLEPLDFAGDLVVLQGLTLKVANLKASDVRLEPEQNFLWPV